MKKANYLISILTIATGVFFLIYGRRFAEIRLDGITSSASWPNILSYLLIFLGVVLGVYNTISKYIPPSKIDFKSYEFHMLLIVIAMVIALLLVWRYFGTLISLAIFLPALSLLLGERRWYVLLAYDAGEILCVWLIFEKLLNSPLAKPFFV